MKFLLNLKIGRLKAAFQDGEGSIKIINLKINFHKKKINY